MSKYIYFFRTIETFLLIIGKYADFSCFGRLVEIVSKFYADFIADDLNFSSFNKLNVRYVLIKERTFNNEYADLTFLSDILK